VHWWGFTTAHPYLLLINGRKIEKVFSNLPVIGNKLMPKHSLCKPVGYETTQGHYIWYFIDFLTLVGSGWLVLKISYLSFVNLGLFCLVTPKKKRLPVEGCPYKPPSDVYKVQTKSIFSNYNSCITMIESNKAWCFFWLSVISLLGIHTLNAQHKQPQLIDIEVGANGSSPIELTAIGNRLMFTAKTSAYGYEPYISDGVTARRLGDFYSSTDGSGANSFIMLTVAGETYAYYFLNDNTDGRSSVLYRTKITDDITQSTTTFVARANPAGGDKGEYMVKIGNELFFAAQHATNRQELFRNDGTNTVLVQDLNPNSVGGGFTLPSNPQSLTNINDILFFSADNSPTYDGVNDSNRELGIRNGSDANTFMIDINSAGSSKPRHFVEKDGLAYFVAEDNTGTHLWTSDGTNTMPTKIAFPAEVTSINEQVGLVVAGGKLFFSGAGKLWVFDKGVFTKMDVPDNPENLTNVGGVCFFAASGLDDQGLAAGIELWKSDGTNAGTVLVKNIANSFFPSSPKYLTVVRGIVEGVTKELVYFQAFDTDNGIGLWKSDGTEAGTVRVVVPTLKSNISSPSLITAVPVDGQRDGYFFVATDDNLGVELWYAAPCPSATLSYGSNTICVGDGSISPNLVDDDGASITTSGITYSIDKTSLSIDTKTGVITPDASTNAGDYTITCKIEGGECDIVTKVVVTVKTGGGGAATPPDAKIVTLANGFSFDTTIQPENDALAGMVTSLDGKYLYIADQRNHQIKKIDLTTNAVSLVAGSGAAGFNDANGNAAQFNYPSGIAIDVSGNLYVADKNNHAIRLITNPSGASPAVTTIAGNSNYPTPAEGNVTGAIATAQFAQPSDVAVDAAGNVYVVDKNNHRIKKIANGMVTTLAGPVADVVNFPDFANGRADGAGGVARFYYPTGVTLDLSETYLYITDKLNNLIRRVSTTDGTTVTYAGNINVNESGRTDGALIDARFKNPAGITIDAVGDLYIADTHNQVIRKTSGGQVTTIAGTYGEGDAKDGLAENAEFRFPSGVFADLEQNVYISDKLNFTVRKYYLDNTRGRVVTGKAICTGTSGTLELKDFGAYAVDKWQSSPDGANWTDIAGTNGATTINYTNASATTFYRALLITGGCTSEPSNYAILKIGGPAPPKVGEDQVRCGDGAVTVTASGGTNGSYVWYDKDGNVDNTQTNDSYTATLTAGTYTVQVAIKGANCESTKVPIKITVNAEPKPVVDPTGAQEVCLGQSHTYQVTTDNTASGYTYKWEVTNGTIVGVDNAAEVTVKWEALGTGTLKVTEQNGPSCSGVSAVYSVNINNATATPEAVDGSACGGATGVKITLTAKNATGSMQYLWYDAATGGNLLKTSADANDATYETNPITTTTTYYVSIKGTSCETERVAVVANVLSGAPDAPTNALASPQTRCGAGEVTFTAEGAVSGQTYRWYDAATGGNLLQDDAVADFKIGVPLGTTTYYVSIHNTSCGGESARVAVAVDVTNTGGTPPNVENREVCFGGTAVLVANKADGSPRGVGEEFRWYTQATGGDYDKNGDGSPKGVSGSYTIPNLQQDVTYYVSFYNGSCETDRVAVNAKVQAIPNPVVTNGSRCETGSVTLTASGATAGQEYRWFLDSGTSSWLQSSTKNTYDTPNLNVGERSFYVQIVDPSGCTSERIEVKAIVKSAGTPPDAPVASAIPPTRCTAGTFTIEATGAAGGQVYKWYGDAAKTDLKKTSADHTDNQYTTVSHNGATSYYVTIVDASCGNAESAATEVKVDVTAGLADPVPVAATICGAGTANLSATGGTEGQYRWYSDLTSTDVLSTSANFTTPNISQNTTYYVSLFDGTCETDRVAVVATVEAAPTASFDGSSLACINSEVTYTAASTGLQYTWTVSAEGTVTAGGGVADNFVTVRWTSGNLGKVSLEEQVGSCKANTDKNVSLNPKPAIPVVTGDITEVCAYALGTTNEAVYSISAPNPDYTYEWKIVNGAAAGTIAFTNTDATQVRIRWSNSLPTDIFTETFEVVAKAKNTGCTSDVLTQSVKIKRTPIKPLLVDKVDSVYVNTIRTYATTTNNAGAGNTYNWQVKGGAIQSQTDNQVTIKWSNTAATQELFVIETVTATGCINHSDTATIYIFPYNITAKALHPVICEGGQIQLQATDVNAGNFAWYTAATGGTAQYQSTNNGSDSDVLKVTQNTAGLYTYYVSPVTLSGVNGVDDSGGDNARIAVSFEVKNNDPANFTVVGDTTNAQNCTPNGAGGGAVELTTVSGGFAGAPYTYVWSKAEDANYSADTRNISDLTPGTYSVQVIDAGGCMSDIQSFVIEDKRQYVTDAKLTATSTGSLALNAMGDTATITVGESLILTATATDAATFAWTANTDADVANISDVTSNSPTLTPKQTTSYTVQLTNDKGCDTTLTMVVRVLSFEVFVPSMFTPNNDQKNDRFQVFGNQVESLTIKVYSRSGMLVYESNNKDELMGSNEFGVKTGETQNNGWDGTYQQRPVPKGNYVWYLRGRYKNGVEIKKSGNVLLVR
jgi:gliding motility-associated-like protein